MVKPIILADDPEPEPPAPKRFWVVRYIDGPTSHSVLCQDGSDGTFYSHQPDKVILFEDEGSAQQVRGVRAARGYDHEYAAEPFDSLPDDFVALVLEHHPYFNKENP